MRAVAKGQSERICPHVIEALYAIPRQVKNSTTTTMVPMIFHDPCGDRVAQGPAFLEQENE